MIVFIDTSVFYALLDRDDANHGRAKKVWAELLDSDTALVTSNYIVVEASALVQNRLGLEALRAFHADLLPLAHIEWIDEPLHRSGLSALLAASKRKLSLVDCVSFEIMRKAGIKTAFVFDPHFKEQGFHSIP